MAHHSSLHPSCGFLAANYSSHSGPFLWRTKQCSKGEMSEFSPLLKDEVSSSFPVRTWLGQETDWEVASTWWPYRSWVKRFLGCTRRACHAAAVVTVKDVCCRVRLLHIQMDFMLYLNLSNNTQFKRCPFHSV